MNSHKVIAVAAFLAWAGTAWAENWPQWRGPLFTGSSPSEKNLPASWSKTDKVIWSTPLPGPGSATPIVWGDRVFISSTDATSSDLLALGLSAADGKVLWRRKLGVGAKVPQNTMASPSPATDGKRVVFLYGSGDLAALDFDGNVIWSRNLVEEYGNFCIKYGYSSSPLLYGGNLYVVVLRRPRPYYPPPVPEGKSLDSYLLAIDPATGKNIWRHVRPSEAVDESFEAYITPLPLEHAGRREIILAGGDCVTGHDPRTGRELWRWTYNTSHANLQRLIPSPCPGEGHVFFTMPRGKTLVAIKSGGSGALGDGHIAWRYNGPTTDSATPLFYRDTLYVLQSDAKTITALDPKTGAERWQGRLGGGAAFRASPTGADGKIYVLSEAGEAVVLEAGPQFKILSRIEMGGGSTCSTIAVAGGRLYIRTATHLYCVGQ